MAPSTSTPSDSHRAPVACLKCRAAKVRCLISKSSDRCNRCITNHHVDCIFSQPKRAKNRVHPHSRCLRRTTPAREGVAAQSTQSTPVSPTVEDTISVPQPSTPASYEVPGIGHVQQPLITPEIRARIIATLATLNGKRGAPFSFITSGDRPTFRTRCGPDDSIQTADQQENAPGHPQAATPSLKLSCLLRPLTAGPETQAGDESRQHTPVVKMPSYAASMALGDTIKDPIKDGILSLPASVALFQHFMLEMNSKWEYLLDPHLDTHDSVRQRSRLLFTTILFCSSKFVNFANESLVSTTDPFLQSRLCSLSRNLAIKAFAVGDRSIETMQAFYLLVCWKDADDDTSYLHSGYAFRILHDLDLDQTGPNSRQATRCRRAWLALFRQDKQQSLFFMRRATLSLGDEDPPFVGYLDTWLKMPHALPFDFVACCSADLRRIQAKLRVMIQKASSAMLPCILDLMDSELNRWKSTWKNHLDGEGRLHPNDDPLLDQKLLHPGKSHTNTLVALWEDSVRLNVASAILRQALMASVASSLRSRGQRPPPSLGLDLPAMEEAISSDMPGLNSSVEGAFGTLRHLLAFPPEDLRRAPDSTLLLSPNAALFLCLLLCLPCKGILGPAFQKAAVHLIRDVARHVGHAIQSSQDTIALVSVYLDSVVDLLRPGGPSHPTSSHESLETVSDVDLPYAHLDMADFSVDETAIEVAQVLASEIGRVHDSMDEEQTMFNFIHEPDHMLDIQSLVNLLDTDFFLPTELLSMPLK